MTTGEGVAVGFGLLVLAVGGYAVVTSMREPAVVPPTSQLQPPYRPSGTGVKPLDVGLALLNGVGGVNGVFQLVDRFKNP